MKTAIDEQPENTPDDDGFADVLRAIARAPSVRPIDIDLVGRTVGRFVVERRLGEGGMGVVYEALDPVLARKVALKVLRATHRESAETRARLHDEARRVASLHHPHIATVYDVGEHDGIVFLALERVSGQPLRARLASPTALTLPRALTTLRAIASGLSCAHAAGIIHRDLKPENVVVGDDGTVKLVDFGIATFSGEGSTKGRARPAGTRRYMAPEHAAGAPASARADVFAFGVLAREVLAATFPRPRDRALRAALERLFASCTATEAERRPADGAALLTALEAVTAPPRRSSRTGALTIGAAAVAAALGIAFARTAPPPAAAAPAASTSPAREARSTVARAVPARFQREEAAAATARTLPSDDAIDIAAVDDARREDGVASPASGRAPTGDLRFASVAESGFDELTGFEQNATPGSPVTAFVDAQGRLVATVRLDRSSQSLGFARGLAGAGPLGGASSEAEVVTDAAGGTVIHVTLRIKPADSGGEDDGDHVLDQSITPGGDVSAAGIDNGGSANFEDGVTPRSDDSPAHPSMPNDKKMNLRSKADLGRIHTFIGPDGDIHLLGGDDPSHAVLLAIIAATGDVITLGKGITICAASDAAVTMDG